MKSDRIDFLKVLLKERWEMIPLAEANVSDRSKDRNGRYTRGLASHFRFIGITEYLVARDIGSFRTNLSRCADLRLALLRRFDAGEPIDPSYVSMSAYQQVFDALAAGSFRLAAGLADEIGGRPKIEMEHDHPFDRALGYALKAVVVMNGEEAAGSELNRVLSNEKYGDFRGYAEVLEGIDSRNQGRVEAGLKDVIAGHYRQAKQGLFEGTDDEDICVWGIGLANLARSRGIDVRIDHELVPGLLLV